MMKRMEHEGKSYLESMEEVPSQTYLISSLAAIGLWSMLFLTGQRTIAYFVGLWAPTILVMGLFAKMLHPSREM